MNTIDINKSYRTRDGRKVRILDTGLANAKYPVAALVTDRNGNKTVSVYTNRGLYYFDEAEDPLDLIEVKPATVAYANLYPSGSTGAPYDSLEQALTHQRIGALGTVKVTIEEGQDPTFEFIKP